MQIQKNYPLKKLTTMQVGGPARFFVEVKNIDELKEAVDLACQNKLEIFVLSGGSNAVVSDKGFDGLVIQLSLLGFEKIKEDENNVWLRVGSGEVLDRVVERVVEHGWWGIENLSWIPGKIGGLIAQNGGAYGQEIAEVIEAVKVLEIKTGKIKQLKKIECGFGYRQSIFNTQAKGSYIIVEIVLRLNKTAKPKIDYPDLVRYFKGRGVSSPNLGQIRAAIIEIRTNKLPDVSQIGNAGSFFKNLFLSQSEFDKLILNLKKNFGQEYVQKAQVLKDKFKTKDKIKIPTAWLIEICGLKGAAVGGAAIYEKQPLVIINKNGQASSSEIMGLFQKVRQVVYDKTGMQLEPEARLVGFSNKELEEYFKL